MAQIQPSGINIGWSLLYIWCETNYLAVVQALVNIFYINYITLKIVPISKLIFYEGKSLPLAAINEQF